MGPAHEERDIFAGTRDEFKESMICPALVQHLAKELKEEAARNKNIRKAREERKPPGK